MDLVHLCNLLLIGFSVITNAFVFVKHVANNFIGCLVYCRVIKLTELAILTSDSYVIKKILTVM